MQAVIATLHELVDWLRLIGMRDRLRCPRCRAVGTWKPHGGWLDRHDARGVRRWMCKWCGLYDGPASDEFTEVVVDLEAGCWRPITEAPEGSTTPSRIMVEHLGDAWPWRG